MNTIQQNLSISDLENYTGIKSHTIRAWENRFSILSPNRVTRNRRIYTLQDLKKLQNIVYLTKKGHKISVIAKLTDIEVETIVKKIALSVLKHKDSIIQITKYCLDFDSKSVIKLLNTLENKLGFITFFEGLICELIEYYQILWQTSIINISTKQFVGRIIEQILHSKIQKSYYNNSIKVNTDITNFILFSPQVEHCEIGLLYMNYLLLEKGHKTIYLGHSISINELENLSEQFDKLHFTLCTFSNTSTLEEFYNNLHNIINLKNHKLTFINNGYANENKCFKSDLFFEIRSYISTL